MRLYLRNLFQFLFISLLYRKMAQIVLSCFVLGSAHKFSIDICNLNTVIDANGTRDVPINILTFDHIKTIIRNKLNEDEIINRAYKLKLFKIEIPRKEKNMKLNNLNKCFCSQINITKELGDELDSTDTFDSKDFKSSNETIHFIIVQSSPTTTKRKLEENEGRQKRIKRTCK